MRGELDKRQWIIFDGDVDPEWVENLNSLLDNTKLLTLPNGERLSIPPNVRIMFEVRPHGPLTPVLFDLRSHVLKIWTREGLSVQNGRCSLRSIKPQ